MPSACLPLRNHGPRCVIVDSVDAFPSGVLLSVTLGAQCHRGSNQPPYGDFPVLCAWGIVNLMGVPERSVDALPMPELIASHGFRVDPDALEFDLLLCLSQADLISKTKRDAL